MDGQHRVASGGAYDKSYINHALIINFIKKERDNIVNTKTYPRPECRYCKGSRGTLLQGITQNGIPLAWYHADCKKASDREFLKQQNYESKYMKK